RFPTRRSSDLRAGGPPRLLALAVTLPRRRRDLPPERQRRRRLRRGRPPRGGQRVAVEARVSRDCPRTGTVPAAAPEYNPLLGQSPDGDSPCSGTRVQPAS